MVAGSFKVSRFLQQPAPEAPPKGTSSPGDLSCKRKSTQLFSLAALMSEKATGGRKGTNTHAKPAG